jgi:hypothetical protein
VGTREADNECSTVLTHGLEVLDVRVSAAREQQAVFERRWLREELSFGFFVGCDLDATDLVGEPTVRGVQLDRGGIRGREPAREYVAQLLLERERGAILDHDVLEPRDRRMSLGGKRLDTQALGEASKHLPHELSEARPRQPVVEGLVRDSGVVLMIELAQQVRDRFGLCTPEAAVEADLIDVIDG